MHRDAPMTRTSGGVDTVGVLGATSFVGRAVLTRLHATGRLPNGPGDALMTAAEGDCFAGQPRSSVFAFSRRASMPAATGDIRWHRLPLDPSVWHASIPRWIAVCPLWVLPEHMPLLAAAGARRLVALSSTSRFTKGGSPAASERAIATRLAIAEAEVLDRAHAHGIGVTILRPTMIYDGIHDKNVARIARFILKAGFFPIAGAANGKRQPIHADDVAAACETVLGRDGLRDIYDISGGEVLAYREMVRRIFAWLGKPPRLASIPRPLIRAGLPLAHLLPGMAPMAAMADRMNQDLVFDHGEAERDFGFSPRPFALPSRSGSNHATDIPLRHSVDDSMKEPPP